MRTLLTILLVIAAAASNAATFVVTKTADTNDGTCDGDCSLREAIIAANGNPGPGDVTVLEIRRREILGRNS